MEPILEIRDLTIQRGKRQVLQVEQLAIQAGEVLAVIGPNGAGKSTLLLALAGLLHPEHGEIRFHGRAICGKENLAFRRCTGLVLQDPLLLDASVFDNVAAGLRFRRLPRSIVAGRVEEWLERLGIRALRSRRARHISGGEAQRVSLARAFALQPEVLLLDEPFSALDAPTRLRLQQDLQRLLADTRITAVFITHDLDEAMLLGQRVAVLLDGQIRQVGEPQAVFNAPADEEVAAFVGVETVIPGRVLASLDGQAIVEAYGLRLEAVGDYPTGRRVLFCLRPEDVTLFPAGAAPHSSAHNRLSGSITRMAAQGPLVRVEVDCGFALMAIVTRASAREMGLAEGETVTATFKATAVHLIPK